MGFIKDFFKRDKAVAMKIIDLLNQGYSLMSVNRQLYDIPEVRTAVNFVAETVANIPFYHARADNEGNIEQVNDPVQYVLSVRTNPLQTPQVFWTSAVTRLLLTNNAFYFPDWNESGSLAAIYPLPFSEYQLSQQDGRLLITFNSSRDYTFFYDDIIHLQRFPGANGGEKRQATGNYAQMISAMQEQAVKDSVNSQRIAALLQVKTALKGADMKKKLEEFKDLFLTSENTTGFGMIGGDYEVHDLNMKTTPLNKELLESIIGYLYSYFGVSDKIITHTASEIEYEQFVEHPIKPIVYQIEEELTYKLFSQPEIYHNNRILSELVDLEISTLSAKTTFYKEMIFGGVISRNEVRKRIGLKKGPPELDRFMESKNFQTLTPGNYVVEGGENNESGNQDPAV